MDKFDFFNRVVFGYIRKDLENMKNYLPKKPGEEGNNNFPIALCVLSYMEYLGSFFTLDDFNFEENVKVYIEKCFKNSSEYHPAILGDLFRNGLAHDYFARGGVARDGNRHGLYRNWDNKAVLDADTLLNDFLLSLNKFAEELSDHNFIERMKIAKQRINDMEAKYASEINNLPFIGDMRGARTSGATVYPGSIKKKTTTTLPYDKNEK